MLSRWAVACILAVAPVTGLATDCDAASCGRDDDLPQIQFLQVDHVLTLPSSGSATDNVLLGSSSVAHITLENLSVDSLAEKTTNLSAPSLAGAASHRSVSATTATTTLDPTGLTLNAEGDLEAFLAALVLNVITIAALITFFSCMRPKYPMVYAGNVEAGIAPMTPPEGFWGWLTASSQTTMQQVIDSVGLDQAMLLEFCHLGMKIMTIIGLPMFFIVGPMNWAFGGNAAGEDHLSYLSMGNVQDGVWLYWVHAICVWLVVFVVQASVYRAQKAFLELRFEWLRGLPELRANTVLVEGIPDEYQSDGKLKEFFGKMAPGVKMKSAYVVRDTEKLSALAHQYEVADLHLQQAEAHWKLDDNAPEKKPMVRPSAFAAKVDAIEYYKTEVASLKPQIDEERARINSAANEVGGVNLSRGFVTFEERVHAAVAVQIQVSPDTEEWVMTVPPEPRDLLWLDLQQDPDAEFVRHVLGYGLIVGLFFVYMPLVIGITNIAKMINMGPLQSVWQGLAPTMGLQVMVAFLPTLLVTIFHNFFTLRANVWAQVKIQEYYFEFQVVFVILATAVGQNVNGFVTTLFTDPFAIFGVLAETMPYATHFYMNFLVLQWVTHFTNLCRTSTFAKYHAFSKLFDEETAKEMSEPEDQDYYGIGSRFARFTINLAIGIVFGTLSPPINLLCLANFVVCRYVYGYLLPYAETKKPDIGGVFWVAALKNLFSANIIYCILMIGVLTQRAATYGPMVLAAPSIVYVLWSRKRFETAFSWEMLPHAELSNKGHKRREMTGTYTQPVLDAAAKK